jgi:WXG100 family type VII secretion target
MSRVSEKENRMADQIRMNFEAMDGMIHAFGQAAGTLDDVLGEVNNIANLLADGGLIGAAGDALVTAIRTDLAGSLNGLKEKFEELQKDLTDAVEAMRAADAEARGRHQ